MKLQIALDDITREAAKVLLEKIQEDVDIIEIGTPFAYYNDISVIQEFKNLYPKAKILADYKINIANMINCSKKDNAYTLVEVNGKVSEGTVEKIKAIDGVVRVNVIG